MPPHDIIYLKLHLFPFFLSLFVLVLIMFLTLFPVKGELYSFVWGVWAVGIGDTSVFSRHTCCCWPLQERQGHSCHMW